MIFNKTVREDVRFCVVKISSGDEFLWTQYPNVGFHKMRDFSWPSEGKWPSQKDPAAWRQDKSAHIEDWYLFKFETNIA
jgi:hypothetical protein